MAVNSEKQKWLKGHFLLNLGFAPKFFGYCDEDLYHLATGRLREWTCGLEYYFGLSVKGVQNKVEDFPRKIVEERLITVMHAPFVHERYPNREMSKEIVYKWIRLQLSRADENAWHRLPKAMELSSAVHAKKINIHTPEIMFAPHTARLFRELMHLAEKRNIIICLENNRRKPKAQKKDKSEWEMAHNPLRLIEYLRQNNLDKIFLTIDTAHLAASGYDVREMWEHIKQLVGNDINSVISHFHIVDYDVKKEWDALAPGKGSIGASTLRALVDDLYALDYAGTISIEVAPLYYYENRPKLVWNVAKRVLSPFKSNLKEEEEYIMGMIQGLL